MRQVSMSRSQDACGRGTPSIERSQRARPKCTLPRPSLPPNTEATFAKRSKLSSTLLSCVLVVLFYFGLSYFPVCGRLSPRQLGAGGGQGELLAQDSRPNAVPPCSKGHRATGWGREPHPAAPGAHARMAEEGGVPRNAGKNGEHQPRKTHTARVPGPGDTGLGALLKAQEPSGISPTRYSGGTQGRGEVTCPRARS